MNDRPRIKLNLTATEKIIEFLGWVALFGIWVLTLTNYSELPETIPIHYNGSGTADGFGGKDAIFILPFLSSAMFIGLTILSKYPHVFNYPTSITKDNAFRQYTIATQMIRFLKLVIVIIFGLIVFKTIQNANGNADGLGVWFLPMILGLIFIPMTYFIIKSKFIKKV